MNKQRRKVIAEAVALLYQVKHLLEPTRDEEQETFENMPESLQQSERGQLSEQWADALDTAVGELEDIINNLEEGIE